MDNDDLLLVIDRNANLERKIGIRDILTGHHKVTGLKIKLRKMGRPRCGKDILCKDLLHGVRGVGDELTNKDLLVRVERASHNVEDLYSPDTRDKIQKELSFETCRETEAKIMSILFIEFTFQKV